MINDRSNHAVLGTPYGERSTKQYNLARTTGAGSKKAKIMQKTGEKEKKTTKNWA